MSSSANNRIQYITGLRGLAILMVLLFHVLPTCFSNGFYGVDIFLVISGYLLFLGWQKDASFNFWIFFRKKIVRIYPSLACMLLITTICVIPFFYHTYNAFLFGRSSFFSLLGVSNFYYMKEYANYFATDSNMNPLLHTWYLSVTLQIYLLWALGCLVFRHVSAAFRYVGIILLFLASFIYCFSYEIQGLLISGGFTGWGQTAKVAYYDTAGRLWQVMAGGAVCVLPSLRSKVVNVMVFVAGMGGLCYMSFCNASLSTWCSIGIVVCTVLVLRYAGECKERVLLENPLLEGIGKISFSLYLIHFPILVTYKLWERQQPDAMISIVLVLVSIAFAWLLWKGVESRQLSKTTLVIICLTSLAVALVLRFVYKLGYLWDVRSIPYPVYSLKAEHMELPNGVKNGYDERMLKADPGTQSLLGVDARPVIPILSLSGMNEKPEFVLVGNSVSQHLYAGFYEVCKARQIPGVHLTTIIAPRWNCLIDLNDSYRWTEEKAQAFLSWLRQQPQLHTVVVSYLWKVYDKSVKRETVLWNGESVAFTESFIDEQVKEFCRQVKKLGKKVVVLTPSPLFMKFTDEALLGKGEDYTQWRKMRGKDINPQSSEDPFVISKDDYLEYNANILNKLTALEREGYFKLLHIERGIFKEGNFAGVRDGILFCRDICHITPPASIYVMQGVADEFEAIIRQNRQSHSLLPESITE